jgi:hypothetical protein
MPPLDPYNFWKPDPDQNQKPGPDPHQTQNSGAVELKNRELEGLLLAVADLHPFLMRSRIRIRIKVNSRFRVKVKTGTRIWIIVFRSATLCFLNNSSVLQCGVHELLRRGGIHEANNGRGGNRGL